MLETTASSPATAIKAMAVNRSDLLLGLFGSGTVGLVLKGRHGPAPAVGE